VSETEATAAAPRPLLRYDLGGVGRGAGGRTTVNLAADCDVHHDILDLDGFVPEDGVVDEFLLSHTLEHVSTVDYRDFLRALHRKCRIGGRVIVVQTDVGRVIRLWVEGKLSFRAMRTTVFTPPDRLRENPYHMHHNMWTAETMAEDLAAVGFHAEIFDAGAWPYDQVDELFPEETRASWGVPIPNLGVIGTRLA
jgi:hypothetical protein